MFSPCSLDQKAVKPIASIAAAGIRNTNDRSAAPDELWALAAHCWVFRRNFMAISKKEKD